jgi:hypothetical protein
MLTFEFQGCQHYEYVPFFHKKKKNFKSQLYRDELKLKLCKQIGIKLIVIHFGLLKRI